MMIPILLNIGCKGKDMEQKKREEFLKILTDQAKVTNFEKQDIYIMTNEMKRTPLYKLKSDKISNIEKIKMEINREYTNYKIIYTGDLGDRKIILIGQPYKYKSSLKWGAFYDITEDKIIKVGEFNDKGQFFDIGKEKDEYNINGFYVVMFKQYDSFKEMWLEDGGNDEDYKIFLEHNPEFKDDESIKINGLITDSYSDDFVYSMAYIWWYNEKSKKWKWLIKNTWL